MESEKGDAIDEAAAQSPRNRLMYAALRLFAAKGYQRASTRDICDLAGTNISAIRYYFGDKAGLYRATYVEPMCSVESRVDPAVYLDLSLADALARLFDDFLGPLKSGEVVRLVMKLHFREMVEPSGVWSAGMEPSIGPYVTVLAELLRRHLVLDEPDADVRRLAFAVMGTAVQFYVGQHVVDSVAPELLEKPEAVDILARRLAVYALAMVEAERRRRTEPTST